MARAETLPLAHFERLYASKADPWHYASSAYERDKYAATVAALPRARYASGLDVGCSNGILTAALAARCDALLGLEPVVTALAEARARNAGSPHVRFARMFVPAEWPEGRFDLVVVSEVLDYLGEADLVCLADRLLGALAPGGDLVLVHWVAKKGPRSNGQEASDVLMRLVVGEIGLRHAERNAQYRLDVLRRR